MKSMNIKVTKDNKKEVDEFLAECGYPNLYLDCSDAYEGLLSIVNIRENKQVFNFIAEGLTIECKEGTLYLKDGDKVLQKYKENVKQVNTSPEDLNALFCLRGILAGETEIELKDIPNMLRYVDKQLKLTGIFEPYVATIETN